MIGKRWASLGDVGFAALAGARCPRLRSLVLAGNRPSVDGVAQLLRSPLLAHLELLDLSRCALPREVVPVLIGAAELASLRTLDLRRNEFDEYQLLDLARAPQLQTVQVKLSGQPWRYPAPIRDELEQRFGQSWYWSEDDEDEDEEAED